MGETKFTPTPWRVSGGSLIVAENGDHIARVLEYGPQSDTPDAQHHNANRIVRCVNLFDELVGVVASELAELEFVGAPTEAQRARRAYLFALLQRVRGE